MGQRFENRTERSESFAQPVASYPYLTTTEMRLLDRGKNCFFFPCPKVLQFVEALGIMRTA